MMKSENNVIDISCLTQLFNQLLGSDFIVRVDSLTDIIENKITCTLQAERIPYAIEGVNSETLSITLNGYLCVDTESIKLEQLDKFGKIAGNHAGVIEDYNGTHYNFVLFLNGAKAITDPKPDTTGDCASYQITGTMLITLASKGGIVSNNVITELSYQPFDDDIDNNSALIAVINCEVAPNKIVENIPTINAPLLVGKPKAYCTTCNIRALTLSDEITMKIISDIENSNTSDYYYIKRTYPGGKVFVKKAVLTSGKIIETAGVFAQFELVFQEV